MDISSNKANAVEGTSTTNKWKVKYILPPHPQRFCHRRLWHKTIHLEDTGDLICFGGFNRCNNPPLVSVLSNYFKKTLVRLDLKKNINSHIEQEIWKTKSN